MDKLDNAITLSNGNDFKFLFPEQCDFDIYQIAHALANVCRFGGHCSSFYSVAQHSVLVSSLVPREYAMEALLHDAAEAFVGDMPTPLKRMLPDYKVIERIADVHVRQKFGLPEDMTPDVKNADVVAFVTERRDLMPPVKVDCLEHVPRHDAAIVPLTPVQSYHFFMSRYRRIAGSM